MLYEVSSRRTIIDRKGNDKSITEHFLVDKAEIFADAERAVFDLFNGENDVIAIKRSGIADIANDRENDEQSLYLATFEQTDVDDKGNESKSRRVVVFHDDGLQSATSAALKYADSDMGDLTLIGIRKSKFENVIFV